MQAATTRTTASVGVVIDGSGTSLRRMSRGAWIVVARMPPSCRSGLGDGGQAHEEDESAKRRSPHGMATMAAPSMATATAEVGTRPARTSRWSRSPSPIATRIGSASGQRGGQVLAEEAQHPSHRDRADRTGAECGRDDGDSRENPAASPFAEPRSEQGQRDDAGDEGRPARTATQLVPVRSRGRRPS